MKFIVLWELSPENREKGLVRQQEYMQERKQHPEKYGRYLRLQDGTGIGFSMPGKYKGFNLMELDNEEQMQNTMNFWAPLLKFTYIPIRQTVGAKQA